MSSLPFCRHCGHARRYHKRGLCWACHHDPQIRSQYQPRINQFTGDRCRVSDRGTGRQLPEAPTSELPGTAEKIAILAARLAAGCRLWHPRDAQVDDGAGLVALKINQIRTVVLGVRRLQGLAALA